MIKKIRVKSFVLQDENSKEEPISKEEFMKLKKIPEVEWEEITAAIHVPHLRQDIDTIITEIEMDDEDFEKIAYIFRLYGVPLRPVASGIEIDIREKEPYPYGKKKK